MRSVLGVTKGREDVIEDVGEARFEAFGDRVSGYRVFMFLNYNMEEPRTAAARATEWRAFCEYREETSR